MPGPLFEDIARGAKVIERVVGPLAFSSGPRGLIFASMSYAEARTDLRGRLGSILAVVALHLMALAALLAFPPKLHGAGENTPLMAFDVTVPVPPAPSRQPQTPARREGRSAPANVHSVPEPVAAPRPVVVTPSVAAAPPIAGQGMAADAGAATVAGPGTGAGGRGNGLGSGADGDGTGGGVAAQAQLLRGSIRDSDYPKGARRARVEGVATVQFIVGTDGRARQCRVARSSGNAELDGATCRLIEQRFVYSPARDATGRATTETRAWQQRWWLEGPRGG